MLSSANVKEARSSRTLSIVKGKLEDALVEVPVAGVGEPGAGALATVALVDAGLFFKISERFDCLPARRIRPAFGCTMRTSAIFRRFGATVASMPLTVKSSQRRNSLRRAWSVVTRFV